jgi:uncharacterized protein YodC (DUF2158 family)
MAFKVGDVVRLKTGGPEMIVEAVDGKSPDLICTWLADKLPQHRRFKALTLRKVKADLAETERAKWESPQP